MRRVFGTLCVPTTATHLPLHAGGPGFYMLRKFGSSLKEVPSKKRSSEADIESGQTPAQFAIGDRVAYRCPQSTLWKRGEVMATVATECKVSWGGTWQWVADSQLLEDSGTLDFGKLKAAETDKLLKGELLSAMDWPKVANCVCDAVIEELWEDCDKDLDGYLEAAEMESLLNALVKMLLVETTGKIAGNVSFALLKPTVRILQCAIVDTLDANDDGTISFVEFRKYGKWLPSAVKALFDGESGIGLWTDLPDFAAFVNERLLASFSDRFAADIQAFDFSDAILNIFDSKTDSHA